MVGEENDFCISSWFLMDHSDCLVVVSDICHSLLQRIQQFHDLKLAFRSCLSEAEPFVKLALFVNYSPGLDFLTMRLN